MAKAASGGPPSRSLDRERVSVRVGAHRPADRESPRDLTLAQGISRGERMDYTLQKAVELGVSRIVPIGTHRSVMRLRAERGDHRAEHWAKVVQATSEQCGRARVPRLLPVATMDEWLSGVVPELKLLLIRREGACRLSELRSINWRESSARDGEGGVTSLCSGCR
ncbi:MAG: RsmE family RNA methyltransferase, partial [Actinomycetota bacterium]